MTMPEEVEKALPQDTFGRNCDEGLKEAFNYLGVDSANLFYEFYSKYQGAFGSKNSGFILLDILDLIEDTAVVREQYGFPNKYVVLTELTGGSVLIYDRDFNKVYSVNFEGEDKDLLAGNLEPEWKSFEAFLKFFFK